MFTAKRIFISNEVNPRTKVYDLKMRMNDLIIHLEKPRNQKMFDFYDAELLSEGAFNSMEIFNDREHNTNQYVPPEILKHFLNRSVGKSNYLKYTSDYYNEVWQIGVIILNLITPWIGPFETSKEYRNYYTKEERKYYSPRLDTIKGYSKQLLSTLKQMLFLDIPYRKDTKGGENTTFRYSIDELSEIVEKYKNGVPMEEVLKEYPVYQDWAAKSQDHWDAEKYSR